MPRRARFNSGLSGDSLSAFQFSTSMPSTNRLGSKLGLLTKARISPFLGSIATSAPRRSPNSSSTIACSRMSIESTTALPGVAGIALQAPHGVAAGAHLDLLEAGRAVQLAFVALLDAELADVLGAAVVGEVVVVPVVLHLLLLGRIDPADVADQVAADLAERIAAEEPRLDLDAVEAKALRREAGDLLVGEAGPDRQRLDAAAFLEQALEALPVARLDLDDLPRARRSSRRGRRPSPARSRACRPSSCWPGRRRCGRGSGRGWA